jgi:biotin carboxylase
MSGEAGNAEHDATGDIDSADDREDTVIQQDDALDSKSRGGSRPALRVLLLSTTTGYQLRSFNDAAEQLGIELVFATDRCQQLDDPWRDRAIAVRFHDEAHAIEAIARRSPFHGVIAVGDRPATLAARVAERLGLPGNPSDAAAASGNKLEARQRLAAAGLAVPSFFALPARGDGARAATDTRIEFPCVLKPLGLSGSRGVIRADSREEFAAAFDRISALLARVDVRAARTGLENVILVERFIPGREFAIEGVLTDGTLQVFTIFDKPDPLDGPFFEETIYATPTSLGPASQMELGYAIQQATDALGLWHGPVHAECRAGRDGIFVLEVAARPIGGLCSKALRFRDGSSLEHVLLRHAVGADIREAKRETTASAVMMIPIPKRGILKRVEGEDTALAVRHVEEVSVTARLDQLLEPLPEAASYLGFIFARAASVADAVAAVRKAHTRLSFTIDPAIDVARIGAATGLA